jgi:hypothetical protein
MTLVFYPPGGANEPSLLPVCPGQACPEAVEASMDDRADPDSIGRPEARFSECYFSGMVGEWASGRSDGPGAIGSCPKIDPGERSESDCLIP